jgi:hypothetical protein
LILSVPDSVQGHLVPLLDISSSFSQKVVLLVLTTILLFLTVMTNNDPEKLQKESINPRFITYLYLACSLVSYRTLGNTTTFFPAAVHGVKHLRYICNNTSPISVNLLKDTIQQ